MAGINAQIQKQRVLVFLTDMGIVYISHASICAAKFQAPACMHVPAYEILGPGNVLF